GEVLLAAKVLVGFQAIAGNAEHQGVGGAELLVQGAEIQTLGGAAGRAVLRIEVEHHLLTAQLRQLHLQAAGSLGGEVRNGFADLEGHARAPDQLLGRRRQGSKAASRFRASAKSRTWSRSQLSWVP